MSVLSLMIFQELRYKYDQMSKHVDKNSTCDSRVMDQISQVTIFILRACFPFGAGEKSHAPGWQGAIQTSERTSLGSSLGLFVAVSVSVGLDHWGNVQSMWPL